MEKIILPDLISSINEREIPAIIRDFLYGNAGRIRINAAMLVVLRIYSF